MCVYDFALKRKGSNFSFLEQNKCYFHHLESTVYSDRFLLGVGESLGLDLGWWDCALVQRVVIRNSARILEAQRGKNQQTRQKHQQWINTTKFVTCTYAWSTRLNWCFMAPLRKYTVKKTYSIDNWYVVRIHNLLNLHPAAWTPRYFKFKIS